MTRQQLNKLLEGFEGYLEKNENLPGVSYSAIEICQPAQMRVVLNIEFDNAAGETDVLEVRVIDARHAQIWGYPDVGEGLDIEKGKLFEFFY